MKLELIWAEDFSRIGGLDSRVWNFESGDGTKEGIPGWGNNERQIYGKDAVEVADGLSITASRIDEAIAPSCYYGKAEWQSARIQTASKVAFKYGRIVATALPPSGKGAWPAIWLLGEAIKEVGWPNCGEIDIFEFAGNRPKEVCGTIHGPGFSGEHGIGSKQVLGEPIYSKFHRFGIDWLPDTITWHIDEIPYFKISRNDLESTRNAWPFNDFHFMIINLAMGGWFGGEISEETGDCRFQIKKIEHFSIGGVGESRVTAS
jgi:beta-glucanase (GH16 family)